MADLEADFIGVLVLVAAIWVLYRAAIELFAAGERILIAFARLLIVLVRTLPSIVFAGLIALGGAWLMNHLDNNLIQPPVAFNQTSSPVLLLSSQSKVGSRDSNRTSNPISRCPATALAAMRWPALRSQDDPAFPS